MTKSNSSAIDALLASLLPGGKVGHPTFSSDARTDEAFALAMAQVGLTRDIGLGPFINTSAGGAVTIPPDQRASVEAASTPEGWAKAVLAYVQNFWTAKSWPVGDQEAFAWGFAEVFGEFVYKFVTNSRVLIAALGINALDTDEGDLTDEERAALLADLKKQGFLFTDVPAEFVEAAKALVASEFAGIGSAAPLQLEGPTQGSAFLQ